MRPQWHQDMAVDEDLRLYASSDKYWCAADILGNKGTVSRTASGTPGDFLVLLSRRRQLNVSREGSLMILAV